MLKPLFLKSRLFFYFFIRNIRPLFNNNQLIVIIISAVKNRHTYPGKRFQRLLNT